jgi:hypothetical protein
VGPGHRDRLSPRDVEHIRRTVERTPEVMVKVLSKGGQDAKAVRRHLEYLSRRGNERLGVLDVFVSRTGKLIRRRSRASSRRNVVRFFVALIFRLIHDTQIVPLHVE